MLGSARRLRQLLEIHEAPMSSPAAPPSLRVYRRLLNYVRPYWRFFALSIFGYLIYAATQPLFAAIIKHIIDTLQTPGREGVMALPLLFVGLIVARGLGAYLGNYFLAKVSTGVVHDLRCQIFDHYTRLPAAYFDGHNSGYMMSRITHNVGEVTQATTEAARTFVREGLTVIGLFGYLVYMNWLLSLIFAAVTPIIVLLVSYVSKRLRRISRRIQESVGDMTQITTELVGGYRIVRGYGGEDYEKRRFHERSAFNSRQALKLAATLAVHGPLLQLVVAIALAGLMYLALFLMQHASAGDFVAYLTAAFLLPRPVRLLSDANGAIQKGIAAAESLFEVLDEAPERDDGDYVSVHCQGRIEFRDVWLTYPGAEQAALRGINLTIEPGQTVALVGASGSGKTTLANLIPRFYDYQRGQILLDGVELSRYRLANLRQHIALVTQHVTLFNDTIANNIAYGALQSCTREQIEHAAHAAYAMEFIESLPQGLDTLIGEHGVKLSGGQRQRLALARALLKDAPILILDEATSALDNASERYIQAALAAVMQHRTTLVIAHRLSTIEHADVILVLECGQIVEQGRHEELLARGGRYAALHRAQFKDP